MHAVSCLIHSYQKEKIATAIKKYMPYIGFVRDLILSQSIINLVLYSISNISGHSRPVRICYKCEATRDMCYIRDTDILKA